MPRTLCTLAISAGLALTALAARADTIVIDDTTPGTVYDSILDGFPLPPPGLAPNGVGDFPGNALGIALQSGVTEERAIVEFPLAPLAGLLSADIDTAILTFNIDDVVSTFGPGTTFDGTAAATIVLFKYSGNGTINLTDFGNVIGAPLAVVSTTSLGTITDATLGVSGPLQFNVNVTSALGALLDASATHLGIVLLTNDNGSATSIDNLGFSGGGPPGVNGARLPFLTITTVPTAPPVWDKDQLDCQKALNKGGVKLASAIHKGLSTCLNGVLTATSKGDPLTTVTAKCAADLDPGNPASKVGKAIAKLQDGVATKCTGVVPADILNPCSPSATTMADVATCVSNQHRAAVSQMVAAEYAPACSLVAAVGLNTAYPALCAP